MNIKEFLIDNYIWILAIILITIITIIGFLADKKKNDKKKDLVVPQPEPNVPINDNQMQYQPFSEQTMDFNLNPQNMSINNLNTQKEQVNQNFNLNPMNNIQNIEPMQQQINTEVNPQNNIDLLNVPKITENIQHETHQEPINLPLSEQTPSIQPQQIFSQGGTSFNTVQNENINQIQSLQNTPQPNIQDNNFNAFNNNMMQSNNNQFNQGQSLVTPQPATIQNQYQQNIPQQNVQTNNFNNNNMMANINPSTIPQPISPVSIQQPSASYQTNPKPAPMPTQMMTNTQNSTMQMYGVNPQINNNMTPPQQMTMNQAIPNGQQQMQQPSLNFVYGPQNNNQNM